MKRLLGVAVSALLVSGCYELAKKNPERQDHHAHWGYEGAAGPEHWGELDPGFAMCQSGAHQSPIDIPAAVPAHDIENLAFSYGPSHLVEVNNGHTVQVDYEPGSELVLDGERYRLAQFHFHTESEHTVAGRHFPMELHLVHMNERNELAVVAVFLTEGAENAAYREVFAHLPANEGQKIRDDAVTVNAAALLPAERTGWRYEGSLTTPPCSEGVRWTVMATPVGVSRAQIEAFTRLFHHDNRPVQPLHERPIL